MRQLGYRGVSFCSIVALCLDKSATMEQKLTPRNYLPALTAKRPIDTASGAAVTNVAARPE